MARKLYDRKFVPPEYILPIHLGGTEANNINDAISNLHLIPKTVKDVPGGIAETDSNNLVKEENIPLNLLSSAPTVEGLLSLGTGQVFNYTITDFSDFETYTLAPIPTRGTTQRIDDTIIYTAPLTIGAGGFVLNGFTYNLTIFQSIIQKPTITSPANNVTNINSNIIIQGSIFTNIGRADTHELSEIEVNNGATATLINNSKTVWKISNLNPTTTYTVRIRYKGTSIGFSEWSDTISFTTRDLFSPSTETNVITPLTDEYGYGGNYAGVMDLSDNLELVLGHEGYTIFNQNDILDSNGNVIYNSGQHPVGRVVSFKEDGLNIIENTLLRSNPRPSDNFGYCVAISSDGNTLVTCSPYRALITPNPGADLIKYGDGEVLIYRKISNVWTLDTVLSRINNVAEYSVYGKYVDISSDGNTVVVSAILELSGSPIMHRVYVYEYSNSSWGSPVEVVAQSDIESYTGFGDTISISGDGSRIFVYMKDIPPDSIIYGNNPSSLYQRGCIFIFRKTVSSWVEETIILPPAILDDYRFGSVLSVNETGNMLITTNVNNQSQAGIVSFFKRTGNTWSYISNIGEDIAFNPVETYNSNQFGRTVDMSKSGSVLAVSLNNKTISNLIEDSLKIAIYSYNGTTWNFEEFLTPLNSTWPNTFLNFKLNSNGSVLAVIWTIPYGSARKLHIFK